MTQQTILLDPTAERAPSARPRLARPERLDGLTVGLLDISKARGNVFLDRLDERLSGMGIADAFEAANRRRMPARGRRPGRLRVLHVVLYA